MDQAFLTTEEILAYLHVNLRTIYRLIKAGKIPAVRVGRQWRFRKADIDRWLETQRSGAPPANGAEPAPAYPQSAAPAPRTTPARILVVDDEAGVCELIARALAIADYQTDTAADGAAAIERLRATSYDLLITDLNMAGIHGFSLVREARLLQPSLPVIIITAHSDEASAVEAVNLGVNGYLTKPFKIPRILVAAAKVLGE